MTTFKCESCGATAEAEEAPEHCGAAMSAVEEQAPAAEDESGSPEEPAAEASE